MKKNTLVIFSKNINEVYNRKSALGSYIYSLTKLLNEFGSYTFNINGTDFTKINQTYSNIKLEQDNKPSAFFKKMFPSFIKSILKDILLFNSQKKIERKLLKLKSIDIVLEFYSYGSLVGYNIARTRNIPLILIYDAPILDEYLFFNNSKPFFYKIIQKREKQTLLGTTSIVVYSNPVKNYIHKITGKTLNIGVHQNVDFSRFEFINERIYGDKINIGFLGSFLKWHRVDLLVDAFIKLKKNGKNVSLFLLGDGEEFSNIKFKINNSEFRNDIILPGFVDNEVLFDFKKRIDIGVMPSSNWYGAPNKIFEYGAAKIAVVAPSTPTIVDLFENYKDLLLFENGSFDSLYNALLKLVEDKELLKSLAENLHGKIKKKYSKENTFNFYDNLLKNS